MSSDALREAQERVRRFERLGGVDLTRVEAELREELLAEARVGLSHIAKGVYVFSCPTCGNRFEHDQDLEPLCTGPNPSLDEHEPTVMRLVTIRDAADKGGGRIVVPGEAA